MGSRLALHLGKGELPSPMQISGRRRPTGSYSDGGEINDHITIENLNLYRDGPRLVAARYS
jgi:hypothetical protein